MVGGSSVSRIAEQLGNGIDARAGQPRDGAHAHAFDQHADEPAIGGHDRRITVAKDNLNLDLFTARQISLVDDVIAEYRPLTAMEVSEFRTEWLGRALLAIR